MSKEPNFNNRLDKPVFLHCIGPGGFGGCCVAYNRQFNGHGKMVEIAVSYCSDKDQYTKKIGIARALDNWNWGRTILVPIPDKALTTATLRAMFHYSLNKF